MRNGILWVVPLLLASVSLVEAQPPLPSVESAPVNATLPEATAAQEPKTAEPEPARPEVCFTPICQPTPRITVSAEYLLWWVKPGPLNTPLLTTGALPDLPPGALGLPNTQILFGDRPMGYGTLSGVRLGAAIDLGGCLALEGNYFALQTGSIRYLAASDAAGNPRIGRPFFNTLLVLNDSLGTSEPDPGIGPFAGSTAIASHSQLQGWEINLSSRQQLNNCWSLVGLAGFRSLQLNEDLSVQDNLTNIAPGVLTFLGQPINQGDTLFDFDRFSVNNRFYGGQIGGRLEWQNGSLAASMLGKIAFGVTQQIATVDGGSVWNSGGALTSAPGGVLALPTNMGRYYRSTFSVVPEVGLNLAWNITSQLKATFGYNYLYWTHVARPGAQIDNNLNPSIMPTNQLFGLGQPGGRPAFNFQNSDYWAQGISFGLEFKF